jgi:hypothetical protein
MAEINLEPQGDIDSFLNESEAEAGAGAGTGAGTGAGVGAEQFVEANNPFESPEDQREKNILIQHIRLYQRSSFAKDGTLSGISFDGLENKSIPELIKLREDCAFAVSTRNASQWLPHLMNGSAAYVEIILCSATPIKAKGFANYFQNNAEIQKCVEELALLYPNFVTIRPEVKLFLACMVGLSAIHAHNTAMEKLSAKQPPPPPPPSPSSDSCAASQDAKNSTENNSASAAAQKSSSKNKKKQQSSLSSTNQEQIDNILNEYKDLSL